MNRCIPDPMAEEREDGVCSMLPRVGGLHPARALCNDTLDVQIPSLLSIGHSHCSLLACKSIREHSASTLENEEASILQNSMHYCNAM